MYRYQPNAWAPLKGMPLVGYASEPVGSLFVHAATPGLVFKSGDSHTYLLIGTSIGPTSEPNGSLWVSSITRAICFAYGGQAYEVNRHRVRNNITYGYSQVHLQAIYADIYKWDFTSIPTGQTSSELIGAVNGLLGASITGIQVNNRYYYVPNFVVPYNGGVLVVSGNAYENYDTGAFEVQAWISWSPT
jgi:hypothetical protein